MLRQVAEGVLVHQSELLQNNAVVVQGRAGVLLIDPGITGDEMGCLANDLSDLGQPVVAGFSTHPDWDHVLWHAKLGEAPRTVQPLRGFHARSAVERGLEGPRRRGVTAGNRRGDTAGPVRPHYRSACRNCADSLGWPSSPDYRASAHAQGHAALLIEDRGVLVAGDMLSDVLIPFLDLDAANPIEDYLVAAARGRGGRR